MKITVKGLLSVFKNSFNGFLDDKLTKLSGSLAYTIIFSMGPLLLIIISLCALFLDREAVEGGIYRQMSGFVGPASAAQLQEIIKHASLNGKSTLAAVIGGVVLLIGATAVFAEIQDSVNTIWGLKPKPKRGWVQMLKNRFLSFSLIISLGFLLLVSLGIAAIIDGFSDRLQRIFPEVAVVFFYILNLVITFLVTSLIFAVIFKVLPDAKIKWRDVRAGAITTALLFLIGKFGISFYISKTDIGSTYGTAGSIVVLLIWVYYSSMILYFGAEFTKFYAIKYGSAIHPNDYAVTTKIVEVETEKNTVQGNEKTEVKTTGVGNDQIKLNQKKLDTEK
ncbi:MAG: YihY/virulence factor BrkB family protein [Ferruginibacter sp.]|nr:YihY/virulence factor BrkB family protein [Ferruginibacter sp.]